MSYVSGESLAWLEDFHAHELLAPGAEILEWPARRVDAFLLLKGERRKVETESDA